MNIIETIDDERNYASISADFDDATTSVIVSEGTVPGSYEPDPAVISNAGHRSSIFHFFHDADRRNGPKHQNQRRFEAKDADENKRKARAAASGARRVTRRNGG